MEIARLFQLLASVISFYTMVCFVRILITWIPSAQYSKVGRILSAVCDPYLNLFRRIRFLRIGMFDLSPALALCVLIGASSILGNLAVERSFTLGGLLAIILYLLWSVTSSILGFLIILLIVRLVVLLMRKDSYGSIWDSLDRTLNPIVFRMTSIFTRGSPTPYKNALIFAILTSAGIWIALRLVISILIGICQRLPI
ncbi:MAG: YggT family protein [Treponema sp.]|nr:YggT family protein [Treponema sp.]